MFGGVINRQTTIGREIQRFVELRPDQPAVVSSGFSPLSYRELRCLIGEIRTNLRQGGFGRSARIAVALPNGAQAALAIVAVACSAVAIPLNPKQTRAEIETCLTALRPDAVLLLQDSDSSIRRVAQDEGIVIIEAIPAKERRLGFKIIVPQTYSNELFDESDEPEPDGAAFILQTSGTTSTPKLIPRSHGNMVAAAAMFQVWFKLTPQDCCLSVSPVFHGQGLVVTVFMTLLTGGTIAFPADASKFDYSEWFGTLKSTWYTGSPTLHRMILDQTKMRSDAKTGHSLRFVLSGGAPLPPDIHEGLERALGVSVLDHYGFSEGAQLATNLPPPGPSKRGTCGIPWPDTVIIVGEDGRQLPPGEQGEILVRGPTIMSGYLNAPELNQASFVDGWLKTGDIGSLDREGFLALHGRKHDLINRGGDKISPMEIDDALMHHPAVVEAAAFSVPHPRLGEDVAAAVVLRPGMKATPDELRRYLGEQLTSFKVPRRITILSQLPKGLTGKVLRRQLSESLGKTVTLQTAGPDTFINSRMLFQLRELWERLLNSGPLTIDDDFFEKGGDSLLAMGMLCEVERLTGQAIPSSILFEATTIRQLAQKLSEGNVLQEKPLIHVSSNGNQAALFFFHGDYIGGGHYVRKLARLLGSDQPLFVIAPHGVDGTHIPRSIEAMAADRFALIVNAQPQGPYRLAGFCVGGLVAFEVARLLVATGEKVEMVAMIDPPTVNARRSAQILLSILASARPFGGPIVERAMMWAWYRMETLDRLSNLTLSQRWAWLKRKTRTLFIAGYDRTFGTLRRGGPDVMGRAAEPTIEQPFEKFTVQTRKIADANRILAGNEVDTAILNYLPAPLAVRVIYFSGRFNGKAWLRISSDLEVIKLPGDHESVITDPGDLADHLGAALRRGRETNSQLSSY